MHDYLIIDVETTTFQKGTPYSQRNKLCLIGYKPGDSTGFKYDFFTQDIEYSDRNYHHQLSCVQDFISKAKTLVVFNGKFDLAWLRRYGINYSHCKIFDCQLCEFILSGQTMSYPSLNEVAERYKLGTKLDVVKEQYWEKGIDTSEIPLEVLEEYLQQDLALTEQIYLKQLEVLSSFPLLNQLVSLACQDLLVLLEMEWNGIKLNFEGMQQESSKTEKQINLIKETLNDYAKLCPSGLVNWNSGDFVSVFLYGGHLTEVIHEEIGVFKSGKKEGQPRYKLKELLWKFPQRVLPLKGSALKKEGFYATNEKTLRQLKATGNTKKIVNLILELSKLEKLNGTYYKGLATLHSEKDWEPDFIHGQFNQTTARTGRLSSSQPNLQNFPAEIDTYIVSRYD